MVNDPTTTAAATSDDPVAEVQRAFGIGPCPFATMDWYCILRNGHDGPHRSEDLS
jgi:hypothetical protein